MELATAKRRIRQLETELAVSRKVNEVFLEQNLPPKASTRGSPPRCRPTSSESQRRSILRATADRLSPASLHGGRNLNSGDARQLLFELGRSLVGPIETYHHSLSHDC